MYGSAPQDELWLFLGEGSGLPHRMEPNDIWKVNFPRLGYIDSSVEESADLAVTLGAETVAGIEISAEHQVIWKRSYLAQKPRGEQ